MNTKISDKTGFLFYNLWKKLSDKQFLLSVELIKRRLKINNFKEKNFKNKTILDVGCGSGRWCVLAAQLGAKRIIGVDSSVKNIRFNKSKFKKIKNIKFIYGDNTSLKIKNNFSDITISQGVIHHTTDMFNSLNELIRVTKKNGKIIMLVYGEHGFRWSLIKKLRPFAFLLGKKEIISAMKKNKFPANNIKHFIDDLFVPIQYQTDLKHLLEYLKNKTKKVKVWNKNKTLDHEENIQNYLIEFYKLKKIFSKISHKNYKKICLKIIDNYIGEINLLNRSKLSKFKKKSLIIGQGNHRIEITK